MKELPRISVGIITYNQERLIGRAIESLLCQRGYLYEIVICDDCSTDKNWEVIAGYASQYPDLIKAIRNEENLFIWKNQHKVMDLLSGDLMMLVSGDDTVEPFLFRKVIFFLIKNEIDYTKGKFCVYMDWKRKLPDGTVQIVSNSMVTNNDYNTATLKLRRFIYNRSMVWSRELNCTIKMARTDIGIHADGPWEMQFQINSDKNYYIPYVATTYYSQIGVSNTTNTKERVQSFKLSMADMSNMFEKYSPDYFYCFFKREEIEFRFNPTWQSYKDMLGYKGKARLKGLNSTFLSNVRFFVISTLHLLTRSKRTI